MDSQRASPERKALAHCATEDECLEQAVQQFTQYAVHLLLDIQGLLPAEIDIVVGQAGFAATKSGSVSVEKFRRMATLGLQGIIARAGHSTELEAYARNTLIPGEGMLAHIKPNSRGVCKIQQMNLVNADALKAELFLNPKKNLLCKSNVTDPKKRNARALLMRKIAGILDQKCGFVCGFVAEGLRRLGYDDIEILSAQTKHSRVDVLLDAKTSEPQFFPFATGSIVVEQGHDTHILTTHAVMIVGGTVLVDPTVYQSLPKEPSLGVRAKHPVPLVYVTKLPAGWKSSEWSCTPRLGNLAMGETVFGPETPVRQSTHDNYVFGSLQWFGAQYANQVDPHQAFDLMEMHMASALQCIQGSQVTPADMTLWN